MSSGMIGVGRAGIPQGHRTPHVVITCREKILISIKSHHLYWAMLIWLLGYRIAKHECMKTDKITGRFNSKTGFHVACMAAPPANAKGLTSMEHLRWTLGKVQCTLRSAHWQGQAWSILGGHCAWRYCTQRSNGLGRILKNICTLTQTDRCVQKDEYKW